MPLLTKEQILAASDIKTKTVKVPEWGGEVSIKTMSGAERDGFEAAMFGEGGKRKATNFRASLVARCLVDESGALMFSEKDVAALGEKSAKALDRVFSVAQKLNGISAEDVAEMEKNSDAAPSGDSTSD